MLGGKPHTFMCFAVVMVAWEFPSAVHLGRARRLISPWSRSKNLLPIIKTSKKVCVYFLSSIHTSLQIRVLNIFLPILEIVQHFKFCTLAKSTNNEMIRGPPNAAPAKSAVRDDYLRWRRQTSQPCHETQTARDDAPQKCTQS